MIPPEEFLSDSSPKVFPLRVESFNFCEHYFGPAAVKFSYDSYWRVEIDLQEFASQLSIDTINSRLEDYEASIVINGQKIDILIKRISLFFLGRGSATMVGAPACEPVQVVDQENYATLTGFFLSSPEMFKKPLELKDAAGATYTLKPSGQGDANRFLLEVGAGGVCGGKFGDLGPIIDFMTFLNGQHCGFGNAIGRDKNGEVVSRVIGFTPHDSGKRQANWFTLSIQKNLPAIFFNFSALYRDELSGKAIRQTLEFYRASNVSRGISLEMAIIAAHSALEAIVNYILEHCAGWNARLMKSRDISFADKMAAAYFFYSSDVQLLALSPKLRAWSTSNNSKNGFEAISHMRNKIVHQDMKHAPSGTELHESWLLMQWLVEILIFAVMGYNGVIGDRRAYTGSRNATYTISVRRTNS